MIIPDKSRTIAAILALILAWLIYCHGQLHSVDANLDQQADLANPQWSTDFYRAEQILIRADVTPIEGKLMYGHDLLMIIEKAVAALPSSLPKCEEDRVRKLIKLAHPQGDTLSDLVTSYRDYQKEIGNFETQLSTSNVDRQIELLKQQQKRFEHLQTKLFGKEQATKLFANKNETTNFLYAARLELLINQHKQNEDNSL